MAWDVRGESFHVVLNSEASLDLFPNNTPGKFSP